MKSQSETSIKQKIAKKQNINQTENRQKGHKAIKERTLFKPCPLSVANKQLKNTKPIRPATFGSESKKHSSLLHHVNSPPLDPKPQPLDTRLT